MANQLTLSAKARNRAAKIVRRDSSIPAVIYGYKLESTPIEVSATEFAKVFSQSGEASLISLKLGDSKDHNVIVREVQRHPVQGTVIHVDFLQVRLDEVISASVPLVFVGEAPAVKDFGGVLVHPLDEIELEALPQNLPNNIEVDISSLINFDKIIHVSDLKVDEGIKILLEADEVVALVQEPKTQEELDDELASEVSEDVDSVEGVADKAEEVEGEAGEEAPAEEKKAE